jgi:hypothetical protein
MTKPLISILDAQTGEEVTKEMNAAEFAQYKSDQSDYEIQQAEKANKAKAKATAEGKLAALGLTTDDLRALGL